MEKIHHKNTNQRKLHGSTNTRFQRKENHQICTGRQHVIRAQLQKITTILMYLVTQLQ